MLLDFFDIMGNKHYKFDFSAYVDYLLLNHDIFMPCTYYFNLWKSIFPKMQQLQMQEIAATITPEQCYQYAVSCDNNKSPFIIHFYVPNIKRKVENQASEFAIRQYELRDFGIRNAPISYSHEKYEKHHIISRTPIIAAPWTVGNTELIVIDGNHRVTAKIATHQTTIDVIFYDPKARSDFSSSADFGFYWFYRDICFLHSNLSSGLTFRELFPHLSLRTHLACYVK